MTEKHSNIMRYDADTVLHKLLNLAPVRSKEGRALRIGGAGGMEEAALMRPPATLHWS